MTLVLDKIAARLEALEETILYKLVDRAQYKLNPDIYLPGRHHFSAYPNKSLLEIRMQYSQEMEAAFGRYSVPEERPFSGELPAAQREFPYSFPDLQIQDFTKVNVTKEIWKSYLELVPKICENGDDGHHGSSVVNDVYSMMSISERVHYGAFYIAEAKYQKDPKKYDELISHKDESGLLAALTRPEVEDLILKRIRNKFDQIQETANPEVRHLIDPKVVVEYYRDTIIPLTKKGEILYFMNRS